MVGSSWWGDFTPHLHLQPLLEVSADGFDPNMSHLLHSLVPKVSIHISADDEKPKKPHPLYTLAPKYLVIENNSVSST